MIAKKPTSSKEGKFIAGAAANGAPRGQFNFQRIVTNFDQELLNRVDNLARGMGLNRSAFIIMAVSEKVRQMEKE